jgi:hypothetical protein
LGFFEIFFGGARMYYCSPGVGLAENKSKNKNQIFEKKQFSKKSFFHGKKENFEEYFLNLASAELSFPILINYLIDRCQTCSWTTIAL